MRVALRRLRSAVSDFREVITAVQVAWLKRETKWLMTSLARPETGMSFSPSCSRPLKPRDLETPGWPNCEPQPRQKGRRDTRGDEGDSVTALFSAAGADAPMAIGQAPSSRSQPWPEITRRTHSQASRPRIGQEAQGGTQAWPRL